MENLSVFGKSEFDVYLIVNEKGETLNVFATAGMAIDDIAQNACRIEENHITEKTATMLKWKGRDGKEYSLEIKRCPVCKDVTMDYMNKPRAFILL